ncbi:MAG: sensor histidine kinase [Oscillatoriales cyanobacterium C42_A2020_001]|nr:sensor histidine kinase [Leptolyngbyaceae cyanobacterium C42_A2020_001]
MDFSQILSRKSGTIIERWIAAVYEDQQIEATNELTFKEVRDSLPRVLQALATVLSKDEANDLQTIVEASLEHGTLRAEQGFEPAEIAREYRLLRFVIFSVLEEDLVKASSTDILRAVRLIDTIIDEAIARCFNSYTQGRLNELEQLKSQLQLTNQELTRLVRASQENISQLAHELKTPLTSIIGYADLFLRQQQQERAMKDAQPNLENVERVLRSGRLLLRLINDTLEISRCNAGQMRLQPISTNVQEVIRSIVEIIEPLVKTRDLALLVNSDRAPQTVITDPLRLQQILTNLLSNAIRYTESGSIQLNCWGVNEHEWAISITDTGVGISEEDQARIFDPYFRSDSNHSLAIQSDGTGLGLAIVAQLVKLMQGEIKVQSQLGKGSQFIVLLPTKISKPANAEFTG